MNVCMHALMDGWMDGWMDEWIGWMHAVVIADVWRAVVLLLLLHLHPTHTPSTPLHYCHPCIRIPDRLRIWT